MSNDGSPLPSANDALANLPEKAILDEKALATLFRVSARTVKRLVQRRELPAPARLGRRKVWMAGPVLTFLEARIAEAEAAGKRRAGARERGETP